MVSGQIATENGGEEIPPFMGWMFIVIGMSVILMGWAMAVCMFIAASNLKQQKGRTFCLVVAGIECAFAPFGTILGVFTLVILMKDSVKKMFE